MTTCPHCGQSVRAKDSTCPLCRQDLGGPSSLPQPTAGTGDSSEPRLSPDGLAALERFWAERSDEALEEAAHELLDYTEEGQRVIRDELRRRSIPVPQPASQEDEAGDEADGFLVGGVQIYSAPDDDPDHPEPTMLQAALESQGIACRILRTKLEGVSDRLMDSPTQTEIWILDESKTEQARQLVREALGPPKESGPWRCPRCREDVEGQFSECWNCGTDRAAGSEV